MLHALAAEQEGKVILISNQQLENAYLFGLYKHVMSNDEQQGLTYPDAIIVEGYTPVAFNLVQQNFLYAEK